jgi:hypothetical protein
MSVCSDLIHSALTEAARPGIEAPPAKLLALASADSDPIGALSDHDRGNELFAALTDEIGFLGIIQHSGQPPQPGNKERVTELFRWLIRSLHDWRADADTNRSILVSMFVVTRYCQWFGELWQKMPQDADNPELASSLSLLISKLRMNLASDQFSHQPISDAEALARFAASDAAGDWPTIVEHLRMISLNVLPHTLVSQCVQYLARFADNLLVRISASVKQILVALLFLEPFSDAKACDLALKSDNPYLEFAATYRCAVRDNGANHLETLAESKLTELFVKVADDPSKWKLWMRAFNHYPSRYPEIAVALGNSLCVVSEETLGSYVGSIALSSMNSGGRNTVTETLKAFQRGASQDQQRVLWRSAYEHWREWNFGAAEHGSALTAIVQSELDFAVVGYAINCMTDEERNQVISEISTDLSRLSLNWLDGIVSFYRQKNILLSRLQPYAHAESKPSDWISKGVYQHFEPTNEYARLLFGT